MLLFNRKLYVQVKFAGQEKELNSSAKILDQQQKNLANQLASWLTGLKISCEFNQPVRKKPKATIDERFHTVRRVCQLYKNKGSLELIILI